MQKKALKNTRPSTPTEHDSVAKNDLRFVHSESSVTTNFVSLSHLLILLSYIFINAFWEELAIYPTNASTRSKVRRGGHKIRSRIFSSREIIQFRQRHSKSGSLQAEK